MKNDLIYNGKHLRSIGFVLKDAPFYFAAERDVTLEDVAGASGAAILDNMGYKNVELSYPVNSIPYWLEHKPTQQIANELIDWMMNTGNYEILRDPYNQGYFYYAIPKAPERIEVLGNKTLSTTLNFSAKPYKYRDSGLDKTIKQGPTQSLSCEMRNPEPYASEPYIKVETTGAFSLNVNGTVLKIIDCEGYIEIDSEEKHVYKGKDGKDSSYSGNYLPILKPGNNTITVTSSTNNPIYSLTVIPRWRRL